MANEPQVYDTSFEVQEQGCDDCGDVGRVRPNGLSQCERCWFVHCWEQHVAHGPPFAPLPADVPPPPAEWLMEQIRLDLASLRWQVDSYSARVDRKITALFRHHIDGGK